RGAFLFFSCSRRRVHDKDEPALGASPRLCWAGGGEVTGTRTVQPGPAARAGAATAAVVGGVSGSHPCFSTGGVREISRMSMNKKSLVEAVAKELGTTNAAAERAVNAFIAGITHGLKKDKSVSIVGFGS